MFEDWLAAVVPNLIVTLFSFALCFLALRDSSKPYRRYFSALAVAIGLWSLVLLGEKIVTDIEMTMVLIFFDYVLVIIALILLYHFIMNYTGQQNFASRMMSYTFVALGMIVLGLYVTNPWHHLFYQSYELIQHGDFVIFHVEYGPAYLISVILTMWVLTASLFVLVAAYIHAPKKDRKNYLVVAIAIFWMMASLAIYWVSAKNNPLLDMIAIGLFGGVVITYYGAFWHKILDVPPMTMIELLENVMDGAILLDEDKKVAYWNSSARKAVSDPNGTIIPIDAWYKDLPEYEITLENSGQSVTWNVRASRLSDSGREKGTVLVLHDVTERRKMERSLAEANHMLSVMNGINRHDLKNDVVALSGYLSLLKDSALDPAADARLNQALKVLARMTHHIELAQEVQDIGAKEPIWQDVKTVARKAFSRIEMEDVSVNYDLNGISVLSDPLLERMFYNLVENSIRHGKSVRNIRLSCKADGDERLIVLEDDGVGIPIEDKERIFEKGFGSNTGMGLYLAREIAENTGITIIEKGDKGARFEIRVPSGHWVERST